MSRRQAAISILVLSFGFFFFHPYRRCYYSVFAGFACRAAGERFSPCRRGNFNAPEYRTARTAVADAAVVWPANELFRRGPPGRHYPFFSSEIQ